MKGVIKTYLPEKKYGFIKGDDGKDYFFHVSEFRRKDDAAKLCEEACVDFEQSATPKGYKAKNCTLVNSAEVATFVVPNEFITSKKPTVHGWEVLENSRWIVYGSSSDSPDAARKDVIDSAVRIGANAITSLEYYKTTGSKAGTGNGTYRYTIHNFRGRAVTVAKRNSKGTYKEGDFSGLNQRGEEVKRKLVSKSEKSIRKRNKIWWSIGALSFVFLFIDPAIIIILLVIGFLFGRATDYDFWLEVG